MKKIAVTLIGLVFIIIQLSITSSFSILGTSIDFLLIYAVLMAIYLDTKTNYICVSILAIVYDSLISTKFGISLVILLMTTYLVRLFIDLLHEEKKWSIALLFFVGTLISVIFYFLINQVFFVPVSYGAFAEVLLRKSILNIVTGLILFMIIRPVFNHIMKNWW